MEHKFQTPPRTRTLIGLIILLVGLSSAVYIYRFAEKRASNVLGYEQGGGGTYPVDPGDSKKYLRDLELYGGKANVLLDELRRWLVGLWHGKNLAIIMAVGTIVIAIGVFRSGRQS
ncbi:MAG: hypothetical protein L7F78_05070 [Syntrophales bacterium LBB04]|nr:hypothetical protein [Syntrophales bacterium LBB04]